MKSTSKDVFELIHSLSLSEKRYFTLYATRHSIGDKNNYLKLFEAINKQKEYDEEALKAFFSDETFVKDISVIKVYLYNMILKCLNVYHAGLNVNIRLKELLKQVELLYCKGLYAHCKKILKKAKELALKYEKHLPLLEINAWESNLLMRERSEKKLKEHLEVFLKEEEKIICTYTNLTRIRFLNDLTHALEQQVSLIRKEEEMEGYELLDKELMKYQEKDMLCYDAKFRLYNAKGTYSIIKGDYQTSYNCFKRFVELSEESPCFIEDMPFAYVAAMHNIIVSAGYLKQYDKVLEHIDSLTGSSMKYPALQKSEFVQKILFELEHERLALYIDTGDFEKGIAMLPGIEKNKYYTEQKLLPSSRHFFYFQFAMLYFGAGEYAKSLKWLNQLLNASDSSLTPDLLYFARIFQLILFVEQKKYDLLEYFVASAYQALAKRKRLYKVETVLLNFFKKELPEVTTDKQRVNAYKALREKLIVVTKDSYEKNALEYFDFISWLDSKIQAKSFGDVVREKAKHAYPSQ